MGSSVDIFCIFCLWIATCEKKDASTTLIRYNLVSLIEALDSAYKKRIRKPLHGSLSYGFYNMKTKLRHDRQICMSKKAL